MSGRSATYDEVRQRLERVGQSHLLRFHAKLDPQQQRSLLQQISDLDIEGLPRLVNEYVRNKQHFELPRDLGPAPYFAREPRPPTQWDKHAARHRGEELLRAGKIAAFTVAGGQGSRLGYDGPKGCFPAGAVTRKPLFEIFADGLAAARRRWGAGRRGVPWYIMTSPLNHAPTVAFFQEHRFFGFSSENVMFFQQGVMTSFDIRTGKVLLAAKGEVATNPDGHGGSIRALWVSGAIADMKRRGVEHISYFQVDNPLVRVVDPVFLGLHAGWGGAGGPATSAEMSSKMIPKAYPGEKLGVFCASGGRIQVIEYSDLPRDRQEERLADGTLRFVAGSIAVHVLGVEFVERLNTDASFALPYHRAEKKVPCVDPETGEPITPSENNGVKLERFVFDALPLCRASIVLETDRVEEFAPIKNATGADSVESSREIQTERAARWLAAAGLSVPRRADGKPECVLEISPGTAMEAEDLVGMNLPRGIAPGTALAL